jgi:flagellar biogenesis protein FliO
VTENLFTFLPILTLLFTLAPVIFVIWFLLKFLKIQQDRNEILKSISYKLDDFQK